ncbi:hypothetical protein CRUP_007214, partial [Coryphaenoides rupestris]
MEPWGTPTGHKEKGGMFGGLLKKTPKASGDATEDKDGDKKLTASNDSLSEGNAAKEKSIFGGIFKKPQKPTPEDSEKEEKSIFDSIFKKPQKPTQEDSEKEEKSIFSGLFKKQPKPLEGSTADEEKSGGISGIFKRSPRPSLCTLATTDTQTEMSASNDSLNEASTTTTKEKKRGLGGMFRRTPKAEQQEDDDLRPPVGGCQLKRRKTITRKKRGSDTMPILEEEESVEMQELTPLQEGTVEIQPVEMAAFPTEGEPTDVEETDELMEWWTGVVGWAEWNETANFQEEDEETAVEQAADRLFMAARLFVRIFNQRGASLQKRILELLAQADAADQFHKRTVSAAVGGGVASVAGSLATITGLILAPFTFGASIIVTAVGISVATAGSIASATANITDAVHSNMDRK